MHWNQSIGNPINQRPRMLLVTGKRGAVIREDAELKSAQVGEIPKGSVVCVERRADASCGTQRCRLSHPTKGWVSAKVLGDVNWAARRRAPPDGGVGFSEGETFAVSEARWAAEEACANAGGFQDVLSDSDYAFYAPEASDGEGRDICERWCVGMVPRSFAPRYRGSRVALPETLEADGAWPVAIDNPLGRLGECADKNCACYRPRKPQARQRFRDLVRDAAAERLGSQRGRLDRGAPVRYASVGSGFLLSDAEVLGALRRDGFAIESACVVDPIYKDASPEADQALRQFSTFLQAPVHAFASTSALKTAAQLWPGAFGRATVFCNIDAVVPDADLNKARDAVLSPRSSGVEFLGGRRAGLSVPKSRETRAAFSTLVEETPTTSRYGVAAQLSNCQPAAVQYAWCRTPGDDFGDWFKPWEARPGAFADGWRAAGHLPAGFRPRQADFLGGGPAAPDGAEALTYARVGRDVGHVRKLEESGGRLTSSEGLHAALRRRLAKAGAFRLFGVVGACAHVRDAPSLSGRVVGSLRKGQEVLALADPGQDSRGWVPLDCAANLRTLLDRLVHLSVAGAMAPGEAVDLLAGGPRLWMLRDATAQGHGVLLEEVCV